MAQAYPKPVVAVPVYTRGVPFALFLDTGAWLAGENVRSSGKLLALVEVNPVREQHVID